jgi:flagellar L-ring protein precursor FlgH
VALDRPIGERLLEQPKRIHARTVLLAGRGRARPRGDRRDPERQRPRCAAAAFDWTAAVIVQPTAHRHVGDIVRVLISINDKASLDNASGRSQTNKDGVVIDFGYNSGSSSSSASQPSKALGDLSTQSSTQGQGNIDRSEQIQVSVAAIVTRVLSNGNLVISGSQEVRVNYEMRQLTVAGIVNPLDISLNNTVAYDRIAEARIAYGGRGRSNDFQQPPWGQQVYDALRPF